MVRKLEYGARVTVRVRVIIVIMIIMIMSYVDLFVNILFLFYLNSTLILLNF